jgi:hypothetical protein
MSTPHVTATRLANFIGGKPVDITGYGAIDFWTQSKKITSKWSVEHRSNWMS